MTLLLVLIGVFLLFIFGSLLLVMVVFSQTQTTAQQKSVEQSAETKSLSFRWKYMALPIMILLLTVVMVVWLYGKLPPDVAYHFKSDGAPDAWTTRGTLVLWTLLPQVLLTLLATGITWGIARISKALKSIANAGVKLDSILLVMGNMIALPQLILVFAMLNTFSYNAYQLRFMPLWAVALITMVVGAIGLCIFFIRTIRGVWGTSRQNPRQDNS